MIRDALTYPIRKSGLIMILLGSVFSLILAFLSAAPAVGLLAALFSAGYFGSFYFDIVSATMTDHDDLPDWPSITSILDDIIWPFLRLLGLVLISFLPAIFVLFGDDEASWHLPALILTVTYGCFYFPMAVLSTEAFGGFRAALPHVVFPAIVRALPLYLLVVIALALAFAFSRFAEQSTRDVPYIGWFLKATVALYSLMFQARLIGLLYREKSAQLGWD